MRVPIFFLIPLAALASVASASAQVALSIPILNPAFSDDQLECSPGYYCNYTGVTGWIFGPQTFISKFSTVQYRIAPAQGLYAVALGNTAATGSIVQKLGNNLLANSTYILKVTVGARADYPFTGYEAALMAGNVTVASGNSATPVGGGFATEVISYSSGAAPAELGKPLQILVKSIGTGQVDVAAVTLTVQ